MPQNQYQKSEIRSKEQGKWLEKLWGINDHGALRGGWPHKKNRRSENKEEKNNGGTLIGYRIIFLIVDERGKKYPENEYHILLCIRCILLIR